MSRAVKVGLISDTHGLLRPEALAALSGSDFIVHAGDIGDPQILAELAKLAPVTVVRGNVDTGAWARSLPETAVLEVDALTRVRVLHDIEELGVDPAAAGYRAVISGHSHKPGAVWKDGVLYVNPGSAGRRRFSLPISLGRLLVRSGEVSAELIELKPGS
jgi:putative phosphoesterase